MSHLTVWLFLKMLWLVYGASEKLVRDSWGGMKPSLVDLGYAWTQHFHTSSYIVKRLDHFTSLNGKKQPPTIFCSNVELRRGIVAYLRAPLLVEMLPHYYLLYQIHRFFSDHTLECVAIERAVTIETRERFQIDNTINIFDAFSGTQRRGRKKGTKVRKMNLDCLHFLALMLLLLLCYATLNLTVTF